MTLRDDDLRMLNRLLDEHADELIGSEVEAFADMRFWLTAYETVRPGQQHLSHKQRQWIVNVYERVSPYSAGPIPRGREVPTPPALQNLPKRPPPRRKDEDE